MPPEGEAQPTTRRHENKDSAGLAEITRRLVVDGS
jgi:hypothetical protein